MPAEESIYKLIPQQYVPPERPPMYHSKYNSSGGTGGAGGGPVPPSYSTFPSKAGAPARSRSSGADGSGSRLYTRSGTAVIATDVSQSINPKKFLKKGEGNPELPPVKKFNRPEETARRKEEVPDRNDKPVMGLVADKNFVLSNAVEAVVTAPKRLNNDPPRAVDRPSFGKVPKYLNSVKQQVSQERDILRMSKDREEDYHKQMQEQIAHPLSDEEKNDLLQKLRERWEEKHKLYQALPFARDTAMQIARKEAIEKEMKEMEKAMERLNKKVVYVYRDDPMYGEYCRQQAVKEAQREAMRQC